MPVTNIIRAQAAMGRISIPVRGNLYTRFEHVLGVPAADQQQGLSLMRLKMIDSMLDRYVSRDGGSDEGLYEASEEGSAEFERLIEAYRKELAHSRFAREPFPAAGISDGGFVLNLYA